MAKEHLVLTDALGACGEDVFLLPNLGDGAFISMKSPDVRNRIKMHSGRIMCWTMLAVRAAPERPGETMPLIGTHLSL